MPAPAQRPVVVIGAGMGGLAAAMLLAAAGHRVIVVEAGDGPGGKMRVVETSGQRFDAGPTVMTMKWVFDNLLARCGTRLEDEITLNRCDLLARHYWDRGESLDLFADVRESRRAIAEFAGKPDADGFQRFVEDSARIFTLLKDSFIDATRPNPASLSLRIGLRRPGSLLALKPFSTLWSALGGYFSDPRLRQLFGRYATYCGSSPFLAPATLMLVAHVEQAGVWRVEGGMNALARGLADLAIRLGVEVHYGARVRKICRDNSGKAVSGVMTDDERHIDAQAVVYNGDVAALPRLLGPSIPSSSGQRPKERSLSALVACSMGVPRGVPLAHHTVFFSDNYHSEFGAIFGRQMPPRDPTVYVCAQDRDASGKLHAGHAHGASERLYCLMNLPADGDRRRYDESELERCLTSMDRRLAANGLTILRDANAQVVTAPDKFESLYPGSGGALYGMASHGWAASFNRPGCRGPIKGLYLAGGSVHPGPGVPMAALSGKLAADQLMADMGSTNLPRLVAITGGTQMAPARAGATPSP
ncbi:phytoene desaturase [Peteryoungia desertarenae]|uniref:Phytoene desaturase n=1 Tax=Peteryoungia desertarenae TaxID=1813451 RepID=A0ABX6QIT5_9HYPH|nr:1-hydroxycarotenoid 3,4-desaturase CrtD [Peteryoungia desertarenae]QLF68473.1 phytoene desaturase [Peteryoungia desertarenae]